MRGTELVVDELPEPVPQAGEVLVKTLACGICGSDLHALKHRDQFFANSPGLDSQLDPNRDLVMGHEFCVEILGYGPNTNQRLPIGTRACAFPILVRNQKPTTVGYSNDVPGGYGEQMLLMESLLLPVPNGLATELAALTEPMAVGLHAVAMAQLTPDDVPLVIGCGPVGLAVISALKLEGAAPIIAADYSPARRKLAEQLGAHIVIDPAANSPYENWQEAARASTQGQRTESNPLTGERLLPAGVFFECVGIVGVIDQMMMGAERGCRVVVVGVCMEQDHIRPLLGITKELNLQFVLAYTLEEFAMTLDHIAQGRISAEPLITGKIGIDGVSQAFADLANPEAHAKIIVEPWR